MDGIRTSFFYADEGLVAEYDNSGNEIRSYGYQPDSMWTTDPLWLKEDGDYYWYQNDHLGTPQTLIDINGTEVWSAQYTAFGEAQVQVETVTNNLHFPGQYFDAETGLHYNWFRYYDPRIGRYTRVDPISFEGRDLNLYGYVSNDPVNMLDPSGLRMILPINIEAIIEWNGRIRGYLGILPDFLLDMYFPVTPEGIEDAFNDQLLELVCPLAISGGNLAGRSLKELIESIAEHAHKHNPRMLKEEIIALIGEVMARGESKKLPRGRKAYYDDLTGRLVILDPWKPHGGSTYLTTRDYFEIL